MKQPICVVDTSVIILSAAPTGPKEPQHIKTLRELTEIAVETTIKQGAKLVVPTPVIAELGRDGPGSLVYKAFVAAIRGRIRTAPLTVKAEDDKRASLKSGNVALTLYKSELAQAREAQLGSILTALKNRENVAMCTRPWRKPSRNTNNDET